jgi:hypothetical protein
VDALLHVFDISTGRIISQLDEDPNLTGWGPDSSNKPSTATEELGSTRSTEGSRGDEWIWTSDVWGEAVKEWSFVKLTYDGLYVVYVDELSVQVSCVATGRIVAHAR